jgi:16S rRNA (guanine966-N2)-methyltransferase
LVRVIAGSLGGRRLQAPRGTGTRPTADRVREALFSMLGPLDGARVLDLFAGSGALGVEALSRGASHAVFADTDRGALSCIRANLTALGLGSGVAEVRPMDARRVLREASARGEAYDLVFLDPPYGLATELAGELGEGLTGVMADGARVVSESSRRGPLDLDLPTTHERRYGDTLIRIHQR